MIQSNGIKTDTSLISQILFHFNTEITFHWNCVLSLTLIPVIQKSITSSSGETIEKAGRLLERSSQSGRSKRDAVHVQNTRTQLHQTTNNKEQILLNSLVCEF